MTHLQIHPAGNPNEKLYVVVRGDLSPGQQATQGTHAAFAFAVEHPLLTERWYRDSTFLVLLAVPDEAALAKLVVLLSATEQVCSVWHEPDMDGQLTAVAIAPSRAASRLLSSLPLTLREPAMA